MVHHYVPDGAVERVQDRTRDTKTYQMGAWQRARVFGANLHYKEEQAQSSPWIEVDDSDVLLVDDGNGGYRLRKVPQGGQIRGNHLEMWNRETGNGIRYFAAGPLEVIGPNRATTTKDDVVIFYDFNAHGVKMSAVVDAPQPASVRQLVFDYDLLGQGADALRVDEQGNLFNATLHIDRMHAIDSQGITYPCSPWTILPRGQVVVEFDDSVIPIQNYPYTLDPSTIFSSTSVAGRLTGLHPTNYPPAYTEYSVTFFNCLAHRGYDGGSSQHDISIAFAIWDTSSLSDFLGVSQAYLGGQVNDFNGTIRPVRFFQGDNTNTFGAADYFTDDSPTQIGDPRIFTATGAFSHGVPTLSVNRFGYTKLRMNIEAAGGEPAPQLWVRFVNLSLTVIYAERRRIGKVHG